MELVDEFETSRGQYILGVKRTSQNDLHYIMKWNDVVDPESLTSDEIKLKWPNLAIKFFEKKIKFLMPSQRAQQIEQFESIGTFDDEPPVRILGCTDINGLQYWCEWNNNQRRLLPSQHAHLDKNISLIQFFEGKVIIGGDDEFTSGAFSPIVTRGMERKAAQLGFSYGMKPMIVRNIELEKYILAKPSTIVDRRQSAWNEEIPNIEVEQDEEIPNNGVELEEASEEEETPQPPKVGTNPPAPIQLKLNVAIPIGARGRKRRVNSVPLPSSKMRRY